MVKIVLKKATTNLLWALGSESKQGDIQLADDEALVELDSEVITRTLELFGDDIDAGLQQYIQRRIDAKIDENT